MPTETLWGLSLNNPLIVAPAYEGTRAFFAIGGDRLVAYDLAAGTQQWMIDARPLVQPIAGDGLLFILESGTLKALRVADGSVAWQIPFSETLVVHPVWDNGWLIVASDRGEIGALRATDGQLIWRRDLESPAHALPALAADRVYIPTSDNRIVALRVETGEPVWERRLGGAPNDILALNDRIYAGSRDNFFYCIMAADGRVDWRWRTGGDVIGMPIADERHVYFVALDNVLRALNLVSGGQQWMRPLPMRPAWGPVLAGSTIVVAGQSATLHAFNVKDGVAAGTLTGVSVPPPVVETDEAPETDAASRSDTPEPSNTPKPGDVPKPAIAPAGPGAMFPEKPATTDTTPATSTAPTTAKTAFGNEPETAGDTLVKTKPFSYVALAADAAVTSPPHVFDHPARTLPAVLIVFFEIAKGASATLVMHSVEPTLIAAVAALPNLVQIAPVAPITPPPRH
jgi:outer membrane protein assembly factor BamB